MTLGRLLVRPEFDACYWIDSACRMLCPNHERGSRMRFNSRRVGAAILIAAASLLGSGTSALAAGSPTLRLTPNKNLVNGQVIRITGTGFTPGVTVIFELCASAGHCDIEGGGSVLITASGTFPVTRLKVITGLGAGPGCGMSKATLNSCYIVAAANSGGDDSRVTMHFRLNKVNGFQNLAKNS